MKSLTLLISFVLLLPTGDISMYGLKIHDDQKVLSDIKLTVVAKEGQMTKFRTENVTAENLASKCKLDALIIADKSYLDKTWGKGKVLDNNYKKI